METQYIDQKFEEFQLMNEKSIETAHLLIKSLLIINGGAAVATLGFVANIADTKELVQALAPGASDALMQFTWGLVAAFCSLIFTYLTNYSNTYRINMLIANEEDHSWHIIKRTCHLGSALTVVLSIILFVHGCLKFKEAVTAL